MKRQERDGIRCELLSLMTSECVRGRGEIEVKKEAIVLRSSVYICFFRVRLKKYVPKYLLCVRGLPSLSKVEKCKVWVMDIIMWAVLFNAYSFSLSLLKRRVYSSDLSLLQMSPYLGPVVIRKSRILWTVCGSEDWRRGHR